MQMNLKSKRIQAIIALAVAAVLVLSGAFAWYSFNQNRINTFDISSYPGVNLHDDFEGGPNKDVYVENSGDFNVFVRVKLAEYLQTDTQGSLINGHTRDDKDYWFPHNGIDHAESCLIESPYQLGDKWLNESFHDYFTWTMGGQKYYQTAVAQLGDGAFADEPEVCSDLKEYTAVDSENGIAQTLWADVITMAQWLAGGYTYFDGENTVVVAAGEKAFGNFWIVDTDGWCYWAEPLEPQKATGLLLNSVEQTAKYFDSDANYFIDVWLQAVDEVDIGLFERTENGGVTDGARLLTQLMFNDVMVSGSDGYYRNISDNVYIQLTDKNGTTVKDAKAFIPVGLGVEQLDDAGKVNAPDRLYIGETYNIAHLVWNGADYTNFDAFNSNAPYYNIIENESGSFTLTGAETGADGVTYLTIKDSDGNVLYLSSTRLKAGALMAPFSEGEGEDEFEDEETLPEPEPVPHDPPQFDTYEQCYPGTGPFAVMYAGIDGKIGSVDDTRYDAENYAERFFYHIGSGVYIQVADKDSQTAIDAPDTTYYFAGEVLEPELYVIHNMDGEAVDDKVNTTFALILKNGDKFDLTIVYDGDGKPYISAITANPGGEYTMTGIGGSGDNLTIEVAGGIEIGAVGGILGGTGGELMIPAPSGSGTEEAPFLIRTRLDMDWLTARIAKGEGITDTYKVADDVIKLDMGSAAFMPVGNSTTQFKGTFDGKNVPIENLVINRPDKDYTGLFGYIGAGGTVENVKLVDANVTGKQNTGGIAGQNDGTVTGCSVTGNGLVVSSGSYVGGGVGNNTGTVDSCSNAVAVSGSQIVGGIAGNNEYTVARCYSTGDVTSMSNYSYIGGVVGRNAGTTSNCYSWGNVTGHYYVGGVVGSNGGNNHGGTLETSYHAKGVINAHSQKGGIVGTMDDNFQSGRTNTLNYIRNCVALTPQIINKDGSSSQTGKAIGFIALFSDIVTYYPNNYSYSSMQITTGSTPGYAGISVATQTPDWSWWVSTAKFPDDVWTMDSTPGSLPVFRWANPGLEPPVPESGYLLNETTGEVAIYNAKGLKALRDMFNDDKFAYLMNSYTYKLNNDIDLAGEPWTPIGTGGIDGSDNRLVFKTSFDGNGKTISNLTLTGSAEGDNNRGLFGFVGETGMVKNLKLSNVDITGYCFVGAVASSSAGTISNCHVLSGDIRSEEDWVGGVVGYNTGTGTVERCSNKANVTSSAYIVGGVVAENRGTVKNCYVWGNVAGEGNVGGVVGEHYSPGIVSFVYHAKGTINGDYVAAGGIIGHLYSGNLSNAYALATSITGDSRGAIVSNSVIAPYCYYTPNLSGIGDNTWFTQKTAPTSLAGWAEVGADFADPGIWEWDGVNALPVLTGVNP